MNNRSKPISFGCYCSPTMCSYYNCSLKPINRNLTIVKLNFQTIRTIFNATVEHLSFFSFFFKFLLFIFYLKQGKFILEVKPYFSLSNNYRKLFQLEQDSCNALNTMNNHFFFGDLKAQLANYTNFPLKCPLFMVYKSLIMNNFFLILWWFFF